MGLSEPTLPPGPPLPPAAQMLAWLYRPAEFFDRCRARYGDVFTMRLPGHTPRVMLARHADIRAVYAADPARVHAGAANALVEPLVGPRSVLILDGAAHQRQRRLLLSLFAGRKVAAHCDAMRELTDEAVDAWSAGRDVTLLPAMQSLTLRIILAAVFGAREGAVYRDLHRLLGALLDHAKSPLLLVPALQRDLGPLTPWRRFVALNRDLDAVLAPLYAARRREAEAAGETPRDALGQLVTARDDEGRPLSDAQVRDELVTLLVAGHETTANSLAWTLRHVLAHPAVRARVVDEVRDVTRGAPLGAEHLERLSYLDAVVLEALRLNPVLAHVGRLLTAPMQLGDWRLPEGCMVVPNIYLAHRDPAVYAGPERFDPERFVARRYAPHEHMPFGGGARRCVGMTFALQEMKVVLATVLRRADLSLRDARAPRVARRGVVWSPAGGVPVRVDRVAPQGDAS